MALGAARPARCRTPSGSAARIGTIAVRQRDPTTLAVAWDGFADDATAAKSCAGSRAGSRPNGTRRPAIAALAAGFADEAALIARGGGRLLRCSTFYEDFIKTIADGQHQLVGRPCRMSAALVAEPGGGAFPAAGGADRLRRGTAAPHRQARLSRADRGRRRRGACSTTASIDADGHGARRPARPRLPGRASRASAPTRRRIAGCCCTISAASRSIRSSSRICASATTPTPAEFIAARAECGVYLGLGYRLMRLREKFQVAQVELANAPRSDY